MADIYDKKVWREQAKRRQEMAKRINPDITISERRPITRLPANRAEQNCGEIVFDSLPFSAAGTYSYTVKEISQSGDGWTTDDSVFPVVITVEDDGNGNLSASAEYPEGTPVFYNNYAAKSTSFTITACKYGVGAPIAEGQFQFGLYDDNDDLVSTATNGAAEQTPIR